MGLCRDQYIRRRPRELSSAVNVQGHHSASVLAHQGPTFGHARAIADDAAPKSCFPGLAIVSTDPPYYDNIGYADLSDFFYVWLRRSLKSVFP